MSWKGDTMLPEASLKNILLSAEFLDPLSNVVTPAILLCKDDDVLKLFCIIGIDILGCLLTIMCSIIFFWAWKPPFQPTTYFVFCILLNMMILRSIKRTSDEMKMTIDTWDFLVNFTLCVLTRNFIFIHSVFLCIF